MRKNDDFGLEKYFISYLDLATPRIEPANLDLEVEDLSSTPSQGI